MFLLQSPHEGEFRIDDPVLLVRRAKMKNVADNLQLNSKKKKSMLITSPQKRASLPCSNLNISIAQTPIEQVNHAKVLGVTFDESLSWEPHIHGLLNKLNSRLALLRRISPFLTKEGSLRFYFACVHSQLLYCSSVWGSCSHTQVLQLLRLQKTRCWHYFIC